MKHKAWFRLIMKVAGLVTMLIGIMMVLDELLEISFDLFGRSQNSFTLYEVRSLLYASVLTGVGAYCCFWGERVIALAFPAGPKCCPACGYQVRGNVSGICSECGSVLPPEFKVANHE